MFSSSSWQLWHWKTFWTHFSQVHLCRSPPLAPAHFSLDISRSPRTVIGGLSLGWVTFLQIMCVCSSWAPGRTASPGTPQDWGHGRQCPGVTSALNLGWGLAPAPHFLGTRLPFGFSQAPLSTRATFPSIFCSSSKYIPGVPAKWRAGLLVDPTLNPSSLRPPGAQVPLCSSPAFTYHVTWTLSLAVLSLCCCTWTFTSCSERGLPASLSARASHCAGFSCCGARALRARAPVVGALELSSCGSWTLERGLNSWDAQAYLLPRLGIGRWVLYHWATREAPELDVLYNLLVCL